MPEFITARQIGEMTGLSRTTIWRLVVAGELPRPIRITPGRAVYPAAEVRSWIAKRVEQGCWAIDQSDAWRQRFGNRGFGAAPAE
jgi:predicted DNA-binding transcriptional regulator AlpA